MSRARRSQAARYLTLLITCAVLVGAMKLGTQRVRAAGASDAYAIAQATPTPTPMRGRYNGKIIFTSNRHNSALSIWSINPDGSSPTRLTHTQPRGEKLPSFVQIYDNSPAWSPDGKKTAFISNRNLDNALYTMNADGSNVQLVTDKVLNPGGLAWSPGGGKIALCGGVGITIEPNKPFGDIYLVNVDGSELTKLTNDSGVNGSPTWSPDGKQIAFGSNRDPDGRQKIWVMNADGSNQRRLTDIHNTGNPNFYSAGMPSWSPDGTKILFCGGARNCHAVNCSGIFVMNADGSNEHLLTNNADKDSIYLTPRWSPDGTKIVTSVHVSTSRSNREMIIVMNADGSNQLNLSNRGKYDFNGQEYPVDAQADWQPLRVPSNFAPSVIGFSAVSYTAYEDAGSAAITVRRTGNLNDVASCFYVTFDDTATLKYDSGTLRFGAGEASKTISIPITDNGVRSFKIGLSDNEGNATFIGGNKEATVTILDTDTAPRAISR